METIESVYCFSQSEMWRCKPEEKLYVNGILFPWFPCTAIKQNVLQFL